MVIVHLVAQPVGLIQRCARCGELLLDHRNAMSVDGKCSFWAPGFLAVTEGNPTYSEAREADATPPDEAPCDATVGIHS